MSIKKDSLSRLMERLTRHYSGQYVAVTDNRVIASGSRQLTVFRKAEKKVSKNKEIGLFYIPSEKAHPLLIKIR